MGNPLNGPTRWRLPGVFCQRSNNIRPSEGSVVNIVGHVGIKEVDVGIKRVHVGISHKKQKSQG